MFGFNEAPIINDFKVQSKGVDSPPVRTYVLHTAVWQKNGNHLAQEMSSQSLLPTVPLLVVKSNALEFGGPGAESFPNRTGKTKGSEKN